MVSAPVMVLLYDRTFVAGSFRQALRRRSYYAGLALTWVLVGYLYLHTDSRGSTAGVNIGMSPAKYWLIQFHARFRITSLAFWPAPLVLDYGTQVAQPAWSGLPAWRLCLCWGCCCGDASAFFGLAEGREKARPRLHPAKRSVRRASARLCRRLVLRDSGSDVLDTGDCPGHGRAPDVSCPRARRGGDRRGGLPTSLSMRS